MDAQFNVPYRNICEIYFKLNEQNVAEDDKEIKGLWSKAAQHPKPSLELKEYAGKYTNEVYGEAEIKLENNKLNMYFSHHPHLIGKLEPIGGNSFLCNYNEVGYGVKKTPFDVKDGKVQSVTVKVNDFIDYMPYTFKRVGSKE